MPAAPENRIAAIGDVVRLDGELLKTFRKGDKPWEMGISGRNIRFSVGKPPPQTVWGVEVLSVVADTASADLWINDGSGGKLFRRLTPAKPNVFNLPGRDLRVDVKAPTPTPTPTPPPDINVGKSPFPVVNAGDSIEKALLNKGSVSLLPGVVYRLPDTIDFPASGLTLEAAAPGPLPILEMPFTVTAVRAQGKRDCTVRNVEIRCTNNQNGNPAIRGYDAPGLKVLGCWLHGFRQGVSVECEHANGDLTVWDCWIRDNANVGGHGAGLYCDWVRPDIRRNHFDTNGWRPGQTSRDEFSHNVYIQGTCLDGGVFEDNLSNDASSHGAQLRAGGSFKRNVFLNCPIGFSYGLVNRSKIHLGGVKGEIEDVWVIGCPPIRDGLRPGWAAHFGNCLDVTASGLFASDDDLGLNPAFLVEACDAPTNGSEVGIRKLALNNLIGNWKRGLYDGREGREATNVIYGKIPATPSLRAALGTDFLSRVRGKPSTAAAEALKVCKALWVLN